MVIFDYDGVIVDSFAWFIEELNRLAPRYRFATVAEADITELKKCSAGEILNYLGLPLHKVPVVAKALRKQSEINADFFNLCPGIADVLPQLRAQISQIALVSSNKEQSVRKVLRRYSLDFFDHYDCSASLFGKPRKLKRLVENSDPTLCWYVGDELRDVDAAAKAGINSAFVTWGYNSEAILMRCKPNAVVASPDQLLSLFDA